MPWAPGAPAGWSWSPAHRRHLRAVGDLQAGRPRQGPQQGLVARIELADRPTERFWMLLGRPMRRCARPIRIIRAARLADLRPQHAKQSSRDRYRPWNRISTPGRMARATPTGRRPTGGEPAATSQQQPTRNDTRRRGRRHGPTVDAAHGTVVLAFTLQRSYGEGHGCFPRHDGNPAGSDVAPSSCRQSFGPLPTRHRSAWTDLTRRPSWSRRATCEPRRARLTT